MTDLDKLRAAATGGEWKEVPWTFFNSAGDDENFALFIEGEDEATVCVFEDVDPYAEPIDANAAYICALRNADLAGELVAAGKLRELVASLREEADVEPVGDFDRVYNNVCVQIADRLSALIGEGE